MSIVNPIDLLFYNRIGNCTWSDQLVVQLVIIPAIGIAIEPRTCNIIAITNSYEYNYVHNWKGWLQLLQLIGINKQCQQSIGRFDSIMLIELILTYNQLNATFQLQLRLQLL